MPETSSDGPGLFEPSLDAKPPPRPLYSVQANFFVAFFGGVYGASLFTALNSRRMGRLREDLWLPCLASAAWTGFVYWATKSTVEGTAPEWLTFLGAGGRTVRRLGSALGLAILGVHYGVRRRVYRAQAMSGVDPPSPWLPGLACVGAAIVLSLIVVFAV